MGQMSVLGGALAVIAIAGAGPAARAASLPAASGFIQCSTKAGLITSATNCNGGADSGAVTYSPYASISGHAFGEGLVDVAGVFGALDYSLEVTGGKPGDVVPLDVDAVLKAVPIEIGYAFAEIDVSADGTAEETICSLGCAVGVTGFDGTLTVNAVSGTIYTDAIHLEIEAGGARGGAADFNGGTASADPRIFVDPSFAGASDYSVVLSPGIGNGVRAVPEPATWAMLLLGVTGIGASMRAARQRGICKQQPIA